MLITDLIDRYAESMTWAGRMTPKFSSKLEELRRAFSGMHISNTNTEIMQRVSEVWSHLQPNSVRRNLGQLRAILSFGQKVGLVQVVPWLPMPSFNDTRHIDIPLSQLDTLLDVIELDHEWAYPAIALLAHTGARLGEAMRVTADSLKGGKVVIEKRARGRSKTITRAIPMTKRLQEIEWADPIFRTKGDPSSPFATTDSASSAYHRVLEAACDDIGIPRLRVHDLRHAFAAAIAEVGGDLADVSTMLGHSSLNTSLRYRGLVTARAKKIVEAI